MRCRRATNTNADLAWLDPKGKEAMQELEAAFGASWFDKPLWHKYRHVAELVRRLGAIFLEQNEEHGEREQGRAHAAYDTSNRRPDDMLDRMADHLEHRLALRLLQRDQAMTNELLIWCVMHQRVDDARWLLDAGGADADAKDDEGDPVVCLAAANGLDDPLKLLIEANANIEARDSTESGRATPLVLSCINGHDKCTRLLLEAGAAPASKWQYLTPIQWAHINKHKECVRACQTFGATLTRVPLGRGGSTETNINKLRPTPAVAPRRRRKEASIKATATADGGDADGDGDEPRWRGYRWVKTSLMRVLTTKKSADAQALKKEHPCLTALDGKLREYLKNLDGASTAPKALPEEVLDSFTIRPGIRLRAKEADAKRLAKDPLLNTRIAAQRYVVRSTHVPSHPPPLCFYRAPSRVRPRAAGAGPSTPRASALQMRPGGSSRSSTTTTALSTFSGSCSSASASCTGACIKRPSLSSTCGRASLATRASGRGTRTASPS